MYVRNGLDTKPLFLHTHTLERIESEQEKKKNIIAPLTSISISFMISDFVSGNLSLSLLFIFLFRFDVYSLYSAKQQKTKHTHGLVRVQPAQHSTVGFTWDVIADVLSIDRCDDGNAWKATAAWYGFPHEMHGKRVSERTTEWAGAQSRLRVLCWVAEILFRFFACVCLLHSLSLCGCVSMCLYVSHFIFHKI